MLTDFKTSMIEFQQKKLLSIVIPLYNGEEFLAETLGSIISQWDKEKVEIVMCDDVSTDRTFEIAKKYSDIYRNIKLFRNDANIGMDRNFERVVQLAKGEYIWFSGQDDIIGDGGIEKVLSILESDETIDFIYANYSQNNHDLSRVVTERMLLIDNDVLCKDPKSFLSITKLKLPTFLPSFIIRKCLWDTVEDKKPFYGTHYIQIGVFLALLPNLKTYIVAHPYVKGRIPDDGWYRDKFKVFDITTGYLQVITYYYRNNPSLITYEIYMDNFRCHFKNILYLALYSKLEGRTLNKKLNERINLIFGLRHALLIKVIFIMPKIIIQILYVSLKNILNIYRKLIHGFGKIR